MPYKRTIVDDKIEISQSERRMVDKDKTRNLEQVEVFDFENNEYEILTLEKAMLIEKENKLGVFQNLSSESLIKVRKEFGLHPIIESE